MARRVMTIRTKTFTDRPSKIKKVKRRQFKKAKRLSASVKINTKPRKYRAK